MEACQASYARAELTLAITGFGPYTGYVELMRTRKAEAYLLVAAALLWLWRFAEIVITGDGAAFFWNLIAFILLALAAMNRFVRSRRVATGVLFISVGLFLLVTYFGLREQAVVPAYRIVRSLAFYTLLALASLAQCRSGPKRSSQTSPAERDGAKTSIS